MKAGSFSDWIPVGAHARGETLAVEWCRRDGKPLREPFFDQTRERLLRRPFNQLFRRATTIDELVAIAADRPGLAPTGFVFHASRCGSTLVAQMLAALPCNVVLAEAAPIDTVLRHRRYDPAIAATTRSRWLQAMVSALAQPQDPAQRHLFVKFDSWSILDLPLIRTAFPAVPWVFLYRDPVDILASHRRQSGIHMVPGLIEPELFGMTQEEAQALPGEDFRARVLACICAAGARHVAQDGGVAVNYSQLPGAVESTLAQWFGLRWTDAERATMDAASRRDAKSPLFAFAATGADRPAGAAPADAAAADRWVGASYRELERLRIRS